MVSIPTKIPKTLVVAITELHWKDFEALVDLNLRHAGWKRESVLGQQAKPALPRQKLIWLLIVAV